MQLQFKNAVTKAAIPKPATSHCLQHPHFLLGWLTMED